MGNNSPKLGVRGWGVRRGGQSPVKVTETGKSMEKKKKHKSGKKRGKKQKVKIGARGVRPLRPSRLSLRPDLWTISTSGKPLHA